MKIFKLKLLFFCTMVVAYVHAGTPLWSIVPLLNNTTQQLEANRPTIVAYRVTNNSRRVHTLVMKAIPGVTQLSLGNLTCSNSFTLGYKQSCVLALFIRGSTLPGNITEGPVICESGNNMQCYRPDQASTLNITQGSERSNTLGGVATGLIGTVVLQNNGSDTLPLSGDGLFVFDDTIPPGSTYNVTVLTQPSGQTCTVNNGMGTMGAAPIRNVRVSCSTVTRTVGGTFSGLSSGSVTLLNNGTDPLTINNPPAAGAFQFSTPLAEGASYNISVQTQPPGLVCTVGNASGTITTSNITNVTLTCAPNTFTIGGTITGLQGSITLVNNGSETVTRTQDGAYTFPSPLANNAPYDVTVQAQPANQYCTIANSSGVVNSTVTNINVTCNPSQVSISADANGIIPVSSGSLLLTVTNSINSTAPALNVHAVLPSGWVNVTQTPCASIAPGASCQLQFSSTTPYIAQGGIVITGDNVSSIATTALAFSINGYLVFSVDSPTTASVVDTSAFPNVQWGNERQDALVGAASFTDGFSNTQLIVNDPDAGVTAAQSCYNSTRGGASTGTWYLPAICQLGTGSIPDLCPVNFPTIYTLQSLGFSIPTDVFLWSSTESYQTDPNVSPPSLNAWANYYFDAPDPYPWQVASAKTGQNAPLCTRSMPY